MELYLQDKYKKIGNLKFVVFLINFICVKKKFVKIIISKLIEYIIYFFFFIKIFRVGVIRLYFWLLKFMIL